MKRRSCHLCGSAWCQPPFCRFYRNEEEAAMDREEFNKQWAAMEAREQEERHGQG